MRRAPLSTQMLVRCLFEVVFADSAIYSHFYVIVNIHHLVVFIERSMNINDTIDKLFLREF